MMIFMAIKRLTSLFYLYLYGTIWNSLRFSLRIHHPQCAPFDILCRANIWPCSHDALSVIYLHQSFKNYMYLEIPFVYMHERFILCMLRIHSKGKNNIAFVYDITLFILQFLSITYLGTHILKNMYDPCLCKPKKKTLYS